MSFRPIAIIVVVAFAGGVTHAQSSKPASSTPALTTQDYIDIQQLAAQYAFLIDTCTNGGNDFADLFTPDGEFSVSQQWGVAGERRIKGRAALVDAAGGDGKGGCRDPKTLLGYGISHITVNHVITSLTCVNRSSSVPAAVAAAGARPRPRLLQNEGLWTAMRLLAQILYS